METHVLTFTITKSFSDWAKVYDESLSFQKTHGITSVFRGVSKDDPSKVCAVMQAMPGVLEQFIADNTDMIASSGHVLESTLTQVFIDS